MSEHVSTRIKYSHEAVQTSYWTKENNTWVMTTGLLFISNEAIIAAVLRMPVEIRRLIKTYWMMMYYFPKDETMDIHSEMRQMFTLIPRCVEVLDVGNVYFPRCRGYCFNCGEPARRMMGTSFSRGMRAKPLIPNALNLMRLCYTCNVVGYQYCGGTKVRVPNFTQGTIRRHCYPSVTVW